MADCPWRDKETLQELYHDRGLTQEEIGDELGCSIACVSEWMDEHDIDTNSTKDMNGPWRDKEKLREEYVEKGREQSEIAEEWGCDQSTVGRWVLKFGLEHKWKDSDLIEEMYCEKNLSAPEIADKLSCSQRPIYNRLEEKGIEARDISEAKKLSRRKEPAYYRTKSDGGHEWWHTTIEDCHLTFPVHRLQAIAEFGVDEVKDMVVHHKNGIPWDNRPENLMLMGRGEHQKHHIKSAERDGRGRFA